MDRRTQERRMKNIRMQDRSVKDMRVQNRRIQEQCCGSEPFGRIRIQLNFPALAPDPTLKKSYNIKEN